MKRFKDKLYHILVETNAHVRYHHQKYVSELKRGGKYSPVLSLLCLAKLTLLIRVLRLRRYREQTGRPYFAGSESELSYRGSPEEYADRLMGYDVVSFDVFETLVFRPFQEPTDLFYIVGQKLEYLDFANIRVQAEQKVRAEKRKKSQSDEIDIYDIYRHLEKYCGVDAKVGIDAEYKTELELLYPNPFMKRVYDILVRHGRKMVAVTDMYLTGDMIRGILDKCGYAGISELYVSNEYGCGKHDGKLFGLVKADLGGGLRYIHTGDNRRSDFENPKKHGMDSLHYENANHKGGYHRAYGMSAIVGSAYRGIVSQHFHNGANRFTMAYEYGFMCGGIFVLGYCNFIHDYVQKNRIDKVLFLARDGEVLKKVYDRLYPDGSGRTEYAYWSRSAAAKLGCDKYRHDYFRRYVYHKINTGVTVKKAFASMGLGEMLGQFEWKEKVSGESGLDPRNAEMMVKYLVAKWDQVRRAYADEHEAASAYYRQLIGKSRRVCTVDIGWAGSGGVILAHLVRDVWGLDCEMVTLLAGTNSAHTPEPNMSEAFLQSGRMAAYLYSQRHNRQLYRFHDPGAMHNVFFEMLLSSKSASLKGFEKSGDGGCGFVFAEGNRENDGLIDEIQRGIYDFVEVYCGRFRGYGYMLDISGSDAYAPFEFLTVGNNRYFKKLFGGIYFDIGVGDDKKTKILKGR